jgi:SAM-dependent methyltransferase
MIDLLLYFRVPADLLLFWKRYRNDSITYLDVGCGNHKAKQTKQWLPKCRYFGLDCCNYNNSNGDFARMERFFQADLESDDLSELPDGFFDVIVMCQVLEHLENGLQALERLSRKLALGGRIYVEFPGRHSVGPWTLVLPFMHFKTDPTHKRVYTHEEVSSLLSNRGLTILSSGMRLDWRKFLFLPVTIPYNICLALTKPSRVGVGLWQVFPRSEYVYAEMSETQ